MIKKLTKHGDDWALVIDPALLQQLRIDESTALEISTDGDSLIIAPQRDMERKRKFEEALIDTNQRFGDALRRLAE